MKTGREFDRLLKQLDTMPQILCWNCRKLTPFEVDRCEHCGSAFAGSTGGAYRTGRIPSDEPARSPPPISGARARSLSEIVEDLRRIRDLADSSREPAGDDGSRYLYQCPACSRFVSKQAVVCVCGVRFAPPSPTSFRCPECDSNVPTGRKSCPVCRTSFRPRGARVRPRDNHVYACPRCGTHVASNAFRCSCGARFVD